MLVTGGSRGIGALTARRFAADGDTVIAVARSEPAQPIDGVTFLGADLSSPEGVARLAGQVLEEWGGVDVLVDNAGAGSPPSTVLDRPDDTWRSDLELDLMAAVRLDRALVPGMVARGRGVVIHVSSVASLLARPVQVSYAAAKAALNVYSRALAVEVGPSGVRVLCVLPGFLATEGATAAHQELADQQGISLDEARAQLASELDVPLRRPGDPEHAAELIAFLASDRAGSMTGAQYRVDGGLVSTV